MGTVSRRGAVWRAQAWKRGVRDSATFPTRQQAVDWLIQREAAIAVASDTAGYTFSDAVDRRIASGASKWDRLRLLSFAADWRGRTLAGITAEDISKWRDARLKAVKPGTVLRELTVLRGLFEVARREWKWVDVNPVKDVRPPKAPEPRRRLILDDERDAIVEDLGYTGKVETVRHEVAVAFLIALETGMRAGEILALKPGDVVGNVAKVAKSKTGPGRDVALSKRAVELFGILKRKRLISTRIESNGRLFHVNGPTLDTTFRRARMSQALSGFTFHDARSTAITRLSKVLDPRQLARMVGHSDLNSLLLYFAEPAASIAERLD